MRGGTSTESPSLYPSLKPIPYGYPCHVDLLARDEVSRANLRSSWHEGVAGDFEFREFSFGGNFLFTEVANEKGMDLVVGFPAATDLETRGTVKLFDFDLCDLRWEWGEGRWRGWLTGWLVGWIVGGLVGALID